MARPIGVKETKPRNTIVKKIVQLAESKGISPLDVMLTAMREDWEAARKMMGEAAPEDAKQADRWMAQIQALRASAVENADRAAPYLHAKLSSTTFKDVTPIVVDERPALRDMLTAARSRVAEPETRH